MRFICDSRFDQMRWVALRDCFTRFATAFLNSLNTGLIPKHSRLLLALTGRNPLTQVVCVRFVGRVTHSATLCVRAYVVRHVL